MTGICSSFFYGPGRIRTCDLGIKSPVGPAAASCHQRKAAAKTAFAGRDEQQQNAGRGDNSVLPSVLSLGATAGNRDCCTR